MVSSTLCPAVNILGSQNLYGRAEGIADHYWPWAVFSLWGSGSIDNDVRHNMFVHQNKYNPEKSQIM